MRNTFDVYWFPSHFVALAPVSLLLPSLLSLAQKLYFDFIWTSTTSCQPSTSAPELAPTFIEMDSTLHCNALKCRVALVDQAVVTTCR